MNLFELVGTIVINNSGANAAIDQTTGAAKDAAEALNSTEAAGNSAGNKLSSAFGKIGAGALVLGKTVVKGLAAGAVGVGALVTASTKAYADYEQLVGGVDTLFKESSSKVQGYADIAYKTAGMSANKYMETVTSFSASLLQSLGNDTNAAAEYADQAIIDMSDNANKMGTSMTMIENAYQGFAKQNYTMLDNLKLGYGGTKTEMERLIADANKVKEANGEMADLSIDSFADVTEAIHIIQTEMGITGTTAAEAASTISGSAGSVKAAWTNLMVGLASDNANIPQLVGNVVSSGVTILQNMIPVVQTVIQSIPEAISQISPQAGAAAQAIVNVISGAFSLLTSAIEPTINAIQTAFTFIQEHTGALTAVAAAIGVIVTALGLYNAVAAVKAAMAAAEVASVWGLVAAYAAQAAAMAAALLPYVAIVAAIAAAIAIGVALYQNWDTIKAKAVELAAALSAKFEEIKAAVIEKFNSIKDTLSNVWESIKSAASSAWETIKNVVTVAIMAIGEIISAAVQIITLPFMFIWENCKEIIISAWEAIKSVVTTALDAIAAAMSAVGGVISGIWSAICSAVSSAVSGLVSAVSSAWNTVSAATTSAFNAVKSVASSAWNSIKSTVSSVVSGIISAVSAAWESVKSATTSAFNSVVSSVSASLNNLKSGISSALETVKSTVSSAVSWLKGAFKFEWSLPHIKLPHFSISGSFSLNPPSVPHFSVSWYKKAYDEAMILSNPTIFGYSAASGKMLGGGEGNGNEVVAGEDHLLNLIGDAVESKTAGQNGKIVEVLLAILNALVGGNEELLHALADQKLMIGEREFARLVRSYA